MAARRISLLNNQIVANSGSISNPENNASIIRNSQRVRNDILNICEYLNSYIYYLTKTLTSIDSYPNDAAEDGISGLTVITNTNADSSFGDVFWLSTGVDTGRPKTIKESLETLTAKLIQQQVNISILERVDVSSLSGAINTNTQLTYKVARNAFNAQYNASSNDLNYSLSEYIYQIYKTLFPTVNVDELNTNSVNFPNLSVSTEISQLDIPGCGLYLNLQEELQAIKGIVNGEVCDPSFNIALDQNVFSTQPTNIKEYLEELVNKSSSLETSLTQSNSDISDIQAQIGALQGADLANENTVGISEEATTFEILTGEATSGDNSLFMNPSKFCDTILNNSEATFNNVASRFGLAWKTATKYSTKVLYSELNELRNGFQQYLTLDSNTSTAFSGAFGRHYTINSRDVNVGVTMTNMNSAIVNTCFRLKNSGNTGVITLNAGNGYTIDGQNSIDLNPKDCITIMYTGTTDSIIVNKYTA